MTIRLYSPRTAAIGAMLLTVGVVGACGSSDSESTSSASATSESASSESTDMATSEAEDPAATGDEVPVDPAVYLPDPAADQYYFQSETGNVYCGISTTNGAGCQTTGAPLPPDATAQLADCWDAPGGPSSGARIFANSVGFMCFNQGVFIGPPPVGQAPEGAAPDTGGGEILPAGSALVIDTYTCEAESNAVTCRQGANGFTIGPEVAEIF